MNIKKSGFTLVEIMIGLGLLSVGILGALQLSKNLSVSQTESLATSDVVDLKREVQFIIDSDQACKASLGFAGSEFTFNAAGINADPVAGIELWSIDSSGNRSGAGPKFKAGSTFGKLIIDEINFSAPTYNGASNLPAGTNQNFNGQISILFSKKVLGQIKKAKPLIYSVGMTVDTDLAGLSKVKTCRTSLQTHDYCPTIGATLNNISGECEINGISVKKMLTEESDFNQRLEFWHWNCETLAVHENSTAYCPGNKFIVGIKQYHEGPNYGDWTCCELIRWKNGFSSSSVYEIGKFHCLEFESHEGHSWSCPPNYFWDGGRQYFEGPNNQRYRCCLPIRYVSGYTPVGAKFYPAITIFQDVQEGNIGFCNSGIAINGGKTYNEGPNYGSIACSQIRR